LVFFGATYSNGSIYNRASLCEIRQDSRPRIFKPTFQTWHHVHCAFTLTFNTASSKMAGPLKTLLSIAKSRPIQAQPPIRLTTDTSSTQMTESNNKIWPRPPPYALVDPIGCHYHHNCNTACLEVQGQGERWPRENLADT
jgi:hypothetical protein